MTIGRRCVHSLVAESHIDECLLIGEAAERIHLLTLQLVLDALAIRSITNQRKNWADAFHEQSTLGWVSIVESSL